MNKHFYTEEEDETEHSDNILYFYFVEDPIDNFSNFKKTEYSIRGSKPYFVTFDMPIRPTAEKLLSYLTQVGWSGNCRVGGEGDCDGAIYQTSIDDEFSTALIIKEDNNGNTFLITDISIDSFLDYNVEYLGELVNGEEFIT